eukprot:scaffold1944_cov241-Pinguiococcus_pyrenoidosus.AAC.24
MELLGVPKPKKTKGRKKKADENADTGGKDIRSFFGGPRANETASAEESRPAAKEADLLPGYRAVWNHCKIKKGYSGTAVLLKTSVAALDAAAVAMDGLEFVPRTEELGEKEEVKVPDEERLNGEGRVITVDVGTCFLVHTYVPNSGQKLEKVGYRTQVWDTAMHAHLRKLHGEKPVLWMGDLNVVRGEVDVYDKLKRTRNKSPGCSDIEREVFGRLVGGLPAETHPTQLRSKNLPEHGQSVPGPPAEEVDFVDVFRHFHPYEQTNDEGESAEASKQSQKSEADGSKDGSGAEEAPEEPKTLEESPFTFWSARRGERNYYNGWRLDYCIASKSLLEGGAIKEYFHRPTVHGSDHVPIGVVLEL